jgi:hypothetical protein
MRFSPGQILTTNLQSWFEFCGNSVRFVDQIFGHQTGYSSRSTCPKQHFIDMPTFVRSHSQSAKSRRAKVIRKLSPHGVFLPLQLFQNRLEHVMRISAAIGILHSSIKFALYNVDTFIAQEYYGRQKYQTRLRVKCESVPQKKFPDAFVIFYPIVVRNA